MHVIGATMLGTLLNADDGGYRGATVPCEKGHSAQFVDYREKKLLTVLGEVTVNRAYYYDKECHSGFCPKDDYLDIVATSYSPGVRRLISKVGAMRPFGLGHQDLHELAGIRVNAKVGRACIPDGRWTGRGVP
jgi:hypothetical protein